MNLIDSKQSLFFIPLFAVIVDKSSVEYILGKIFKGCLRVCNIFGRVL